VNALQQPSKGNGVSHVVFIFFQNYTTLPLNVTGLSITYFYVHCALMSKLHHFASS